MITDNGTDVATVALDDFADPQLWAPEERPDPAVYRHRLIVRRTHPGLGAHILDWASAKAAEDGRDWLRIDVWTGNLALQRYYLRHGSATYAPSKATTHPAPCSNDQHPPMMHAALTQVGCAPPQAENATC